MRVFLEKKKNRRKMNMGVSHTRRLFTFFTSSWLSVYTSSAPSFFSFSFASSDPALQQTLHENQSHCSNSRSTYIYKTDAGKPIIGKANKSKTK